MHTLNVLTFKKKLGRAFKLTTERLTANVALFIMVLAFPPYNTSSIAILMEICYETEVAT
jgi:hypothetical protein